MVTTFAQRWAPPAAVDGLDTLTEWEREIAAWVATGRSNTEIADALFLSPATVRTHVARAMAKLDARSRAQLVVLAVRAGLSVAREPSCHSRASGVVATPGSTRTTENKLQRCSC